MNLIPKKKNISLLIPAIFFTIVIIALFNSVFFKGEVIVPGDIPYNTPLWQGEASEVRYYKAQNYLLSDQINQFYVWHSFVRKTISDGNGIPLWNPYIFLGQPVIANAQSAIFYPPNLLLFIFSTGLVSTLRIFFNLFILGVFSFLFARSVNIGKYGSFFVSAISILCGPVIVWLGHPHSNVFIWLPFILYGIEKLLKERRDLFWSAFIAVGIGFSLLGGHPETAFHLIFVSFLYFFIRIFQVSGKVIQKKIKVYFIILSLLLGFMIGAVQIIPFSEYLFHSSTLEEGGRGVHSGISLFPDEFVPNLVTGITLFYPNFFGNPVDRDFLWPLKKSSNYIEQTLYFGLIPLVFFFITFFKNGKEGALKALVFLSILTLGIAWRVPGFDLINHIPVFSLASNGRLKIFFSLLAVFISGFGFDLYFKYIKEGILKSDKKKRNIFFTIPLVTVFIFITVSFFKSINLLKRLNTTTAINKNGGFFYSLFYSVFSSLNFRTMISLITAFLLILIFSVEVKKVNSFRIKGIMLIILAIFELTVFAWNFNPTIKEKDILPDINIFKIMRAEKQPFRIISDDDIFLPNYNVVWDIPLLGGYDLPVDKNYAELFFAQGGKNIHDHSWGNNWPLIDLMNVKFYISRKVNSPSESKYVEFYRGRNYRVFKNRDAFPRAFMVYDYQLIQDRENIIRKMISGKVDLRKTVLLEKDPDVNKGKNSQKDRVKNESDIEFVLNGNSTVELMVKTSCSGFLVYSDLYSDGWKVSIDGMKRELFRADFALRSVYVPEGKHRVRFEYAPESFLMGKYLTLFGLFLAIGFFIRATFRKPRTNIR